MSKPAKPEKPETPKPEKPSKAEREARRLAIEECAKVLDAHAALHPLDSYVLAKRAFQIVATDIRLLGEESP